MAGGQAIAAARVGADGNDVQGHDYWIPLIPIVVDVISEEVSGDKSFWERFEEYRKG